jgi:hypothetical protein
MAKTLNFIIGRKKPLELLTWLILLTDLILENITVTAVWGTD